MYEKRIVKFGKFCFDNKPAQKYFILTHPKHKREYYLKVGNSNALKFIFPKMNSFKKRMIYLGLKLKIIQPFLRKIMLPSAMGELIFCGNQIKLFNFEKREVLSIPLNSKISKKKFICSS